jgi:hypothetical protein
VIRLNVDFQTAFARKPDHKPDLLRQKIEATPRLTFGGAELVELDSTRPLDEVLDTARHEVARKLEALGYRPLS